MKHEKSMPNEFYEWIKNNHPDPDNTIGAENTIYPFWVKCKELEKENKRLKGLIITYVRLFERMTRI